MDYHCIHCHFLATKVQNQVDAANAQHSCTKSQRSLLRQKKNLNQHYIGCYHAIWQVEAPMDDNDFHEVLEKDRQRQCFFYKHKPSLSLEQAKLAQQTNPMPPPGGYTLLGERPWFIYVVTIIALVVATLIVFLPRL